MAKDNRSKMPEQGRQNGGVTCAESDKQRILRLERDNEALAARCQSLEEECQRYAKQAEEQFGTMLELRRRVESLGKLHAGVVNSKAWKMTWPLRAGGSFLRKLTADRMSGANASASGASSVPESGKAMKDTWVNERPTEWEEPPLVSVIVPNYNHAPYLRQRLETIYRQSYTNTEVILLDDASTDDSRDILQAYALRYPDKTSLHMNVTNGGGVFRQWQKGLTLAKGSLVWIAESDDYCTLDFLEQLVEAFRFQSVMLAFARSVFVQDETEIWALEEYLKDLDGFDWTGPFFLSGHQAVNKGFARKNLVPNVSSVVFRNVGPLPQELTRLWEEVALSGDWLFYLYLLRGGTLYYTNKATNYYRVHRESTSLKVQMTPAYYTEYEMVSRYVATHYRVRPDVFTQVLEDLKNHYRIMQKEQNAELVAEWYHPERVLEAAPKRLPNVVMLTFSLQIGGGEMVPLQLANEMHRQGYAVTVFDCGLGRYDSAVRTQLLPAVPLVRLEDAKQLAENARLLGAEILNSHQATVDELVAARYIPDGPWRQVITLHGMYEALEPEELQPLLMQVAKSCKAFIYIADKNLVPFRGEPGFFDIPFVKIGNGVPPCTDAPASRAALGIPEDAFVLCLVSRAIPEKGWQEAMEAVELANKKAARPIHLVLVGSGEMEEKLRGTAPAYVHLTGVQANTRQFLAMADMGLLPSRFKGESYPIVVLDSLACGKPVIASDIGELRSILTAKEGQLAGCLFPLDDHMRIPVEQLANIIAQLADNRDQYAAMARAAKKAAANCDIGRTVERYGEVYQQIWKNNQIPVEE